MKEHEILDSSFLSPRESKPRKFTLFELICYTCTLLSVVVREVSGYADADKAIVIVTSVLMISYLIANYWINTPQKKNIRTISITILYGLSLCVCVTAFLFQISYYEGAEEMLILCIGIPMCVIILDAVSAIGKGKDKIITFPLLAKMAVFVVPTLIFSLIPFDNRIKHSYRNEPGLIRYYEANRQRAHFNILYFEYFEKQNPENNE